MLTPPAAYAEGYAKARKVDPEVADNYIRHTTIGDEELDPVMEELFDLQPRDLHRFIRAGVERDDPATLARAPQSLRDFFNVVDDRVPDWVDFSQHEVGQRAFFNNMKNMLVAFAIGASVEGFGTMVSKSFSITGRVSGMGEGAVRRLRQNNRHMIETYYPNSMTRDGEGWKFSMRLRFVHARVRKFLKDSEEWDHEAWGTPIHCAHLGGVSLYTFSIRQFEHAAKMGGSMSQEEIDSIVEIWRYAGYLLGVPESILFSSEASARRLYQIANMCEPPPDKDAKTMVNSIFKAIPEMAEGVETESQKKSLAKYAYRLSRALVGNELADLYDYPNTLRIGWLVLFYVRLRQRFLSSIMNNEVQDGLDSIFGAAQYDKEGISYKMPDALHAVNQSPW